MADPEKGRGGERRPWWSFIWLFVAAVAIALVALLLLVARGLAEERAEASGAEAARTRVAAIALDPGPVALELPEKVGVLEAAASLRLSFEVSGQVERILGEGARVAMGEEIAALDSDLEAANVRSAELRLADAKRELRRVRGLQASQAASESKLDAATTAVALRRAELDAARERLERRFLQARFDGVVTDVRVDPGEVAVPGVPVARLENFELMQVEVGVPGHQVVGVAPGAVARVSVPALPGRSFEGTVHIVSPSAAEGGALFEVEILVPNPAAELRSGMSARVRIVRGVVSDALVLPLAAVVERDGRRVVFFVNDDRAHEIGVEEGTIQGEALVIPADHGYRQLVVRGQHDLVDGARVHLDNTVLPRARAASDSGDPSSPAPREAAPRLDVTSR